MSGAIDNTVPFKTRSKGVTRAPLFYHSAPARVVHAEDGNVVLEKSQDVTPIIDSIKREKERTGGRLNDDMYLAGRVPTVILHKFMRERGITFRDFVLDPTLVNELLNDPALKAFRIWEGRA